MDHYGFIGTRSFVVEMVLDVRICGQKWFWEHQSVGRNGSGGTNLWAKIVLVARICGQKWFWELEFLLTETVLGARMVFFWRASPRGFLRLTVQATGLVILLELLIIKKIYFFKINSKSFKKNF
jgi:hypothetical protein